MREENTLQTLKASYEVLAKILKSGKTEDFIKALKESPITKSKGLSKKVLKEIDNTFQSLTIGCVENKNLTALKALKNHGANLRFNNDFLLRWAASMGDKEILVYLLDHGCQPKQSMFAALRWAYEAKHKNCSKILLQYSKAPDLKVFLDSLENEGHKEAHKDLSLDVKNEINKKLVDKVSQTNTLEI